MATTLLSFRATLLAGLMAASALAIAQPAAQPAPPGGAMPPPAGMAGPLPPPPGGPLAPTPMATVSVSGQVARWLVNPNGEADGLLLDNGTQIAFAPHLSASVTALAKVGDRIDATGWRAGDAGALRAQEIRANGRAVTEQPPNPGAMPPPPRPMGALASMSAGGRIARVLFNDRGDAHGALLDDGTVVRFPPHVGRMIGGLLQPGAPLYVQGWGTRSPLGTGIEATRLGATQQALQDVLSGPVDAPRPGPRRRPA
ncbi:Uncharacterised protein [Xylophilus ampelinus]|nr:Uncharacterised protein [Xylophilus ampelinus]